MSFYFDLTSIGRVYEAECINYSDSWLSGFFAVFDFWPLFISFAVIGLTLEHREIFYCLVLKGMFINGLLNWGFRELIRQPGPEPSCSSYAQNPAYASDGMTFLLVTLLCSSSIIYKVPIRWFKLSILWIGGPLAIYTRVWLRFNTGLQLLAGVGFGLVEGILYCMVLNFFFTYERIDKWFLSGVKFGNDYEDTKIRPSRPTIVLDQVPKQMNAKLGSMIGPQDAILADAMKMKARMDEEGIGDESDRGFDGSGTPFDDMYREAGRITDIPVVWSTQ